MQNQQDNRVGHSLMRAFEGEKPFVADMPEGASDDAPEDFTQKHRRQIALLRERNSQMRDHVRTQTGRDLSLQQEERRLLRYLCDQPRSFNRKMIYLVQSTFVTPSALQLGLLVLGANKSDARLDREQALDERDALYDQAEKEAMNLRHRFQQADDDGAVRSMMAKVRDPLWDNLKTMASVYDPKFFTDFNGAMLDLVHDLKQAETILAEKQQQVAPQPFKYKP